MNAKEQHRTIITLYLFGMVVFGIIAINELFSDELYLGSMAIMFCLICFWIILHDKIEYYKGAK